MTATTMTATKHDHDVIKAFHFTASTHNVFSTSRK